MKEKILPNAYIIGIQKAGTTSLHHWLAQHPDIYASLNLKDRDILAHPERSRNAVKILSEALKDKGREKIILHSQVNYIFYPQALDKIAEISPKAKLILVLRNPVERAISAYNYFKSLEKETRPIQKALHYKPQGETLYSEHSANLTYIEHGYYAQQIKQVFARFDKEQLLILDFEDLKTDPNLTLKKIYSFLQISSFKPDFTSKNVTSTVKNRGVQKLLVHTSPRQQKFMRKFVDPWFSIQKRNKIKRWIRERNLQEGKKISKEIPLDLQAFLNEHYRLEMENLDQLLNSNYYANWLEEQKDR